MSRVIAFLSFCLFLVGSVAQAEEPLSVLEPKAVSALSNGALGEFAELIPQLKTARTAMGLQNLSSLALLFLELGRERCASGSDECQFFLKGALELAPSDPNVFMRAAELEPGLSLSLLSGALKNAANSNLFLARLLMIVSMGALIAMTFAFAVWSLIKICKLERRGFLKRADGPVWFTVFAFAGLPFGILPTIISWSILLFLASGNVRKQGALLFVLVLTWALVLPSAETVLTNTRRGEEAAIDRLLSPLLSSGRTPAPGENDFAQLAIATTYFLQGNLGEAKALFERVAVTTSDRSLQRVALARQGATEIALRDYVAAERSLQQALSLGGKSYELLQNLALVQAGRAELAQHRKYMDELRAMDESRFRKESVELAALLEPVPFATQWKWYLQPPERFGAPPARGYLRNVAFLKPLVTRGGFTALLGLLAVALLLVVMPKRRFA